MANNKTALDAAGATVTYATDDVSSVNYPVVKLALGDEDVATRVTAANGLPVEVLEIAAGETHVGEVGGNTIIVTVVPTITAGAYSAGEIVGGELTLTNAMRKVSGTGVLHSLTLFDADNEGAAMEVMLFDANPTGTYTDNNTPTWNAADEAKFLGKVSIATGDYITVNAMKMVCKTGIGLAVSANGSADLYAVVIVPGTPTYGTTTDLTFRFGFLRD
jgi:hypothetical protein